MTNAVVVFGSSGMLGSKVVQQLHKRPQFVGRVSALDKTKFDVSRADTTEIVSLLRSIGMQSGSYVVNCVGLTKNRIVSNDLDNNLAALAANTVWPIRLAKAAEILNLKVIQPATDCVYSGRTGDYDETYAHDPTDLYGKTKSLGEVESEVVMHLRSSFIGTQGSNKPKMLFEWLNNIEPGSKVNGFTNHFWNGVTASLLAQVFVGVIEKRIFYPGITHLVPADTVSKLTLLELILDFLDRTDVEVLPTEDEQAINRSLSTHYEERNEVLFSLAGYTERPTISQLIKVSGI